MRKYIQLIFSGITVILITIMSFTAYATTPKVQEFTTAKGMKFWAIEDNYLPIVSIRIDFTKSGSAYDPEDKQGLANMAANLLTEGAGGISGIDFMKQIEELAANISFDVDSDNFYVSLTCLEENLADSLRLLALALTSPDFTEDAIARTRENTLVTIAKQEENPVSRARKVFQEQYFAGHPYARQDIGSTDGIKRISSKDLRLFTRSRFTKENILIGVTGSVKAEKISPLFDKYFALLPNTSSNIQDIPEFVPGKNIGKVVHIEQDVPQSVAIFGFPGPKRLDKDFYPTYIMNHLFGGGGFESRLMHEVREKRGLAYTVYTSAQTYKKAGLISGYVATKNSSMDESLKIIRDEVKKIHDSGVKTTELNDAKDYLIGSFPLRMTRNSALASFITSMQNDNLGIDFLDKRNGYITDVDVQNSNAAAAKYLDPAKMLVVIVGKK